MFALVLQFAITIPASMQQGRSLGGSVLFYFSFFTILTNIGAVLALAGWLFGRPAFAAGAGFRAGVAAAILLVMIVYHTVLAELQNLEGLFALCDLLLHTVMPVLYAVWWLMAGSDGSTRARDVPWWMIYPIAYLGFALIRGAIVGEVPYPFLNVATNGATAVALSALTVTAVFVVLSLIVLIADRAIGRLRAR